MKDKLTISNWSVLLNLLFSGLSVKNFLQKTDQQKDLWMFLFSYHSDFLYFFVEIKNIFVEPSVEKHWSRHYGKTQI